MYSFFDILTIADPDYLEPGSGYISPSDPYKFKTDPDLQHIDHSKSRFCIWQKKKEWKSEWKGERAGKKELGE